MKIYTNKEKFMLENNLYWHENPEDTTPPIIYTNFILINKYVILLFNKNTILTNYYILNI